MDDSISRQAAIDAINELHELPNAWLDLAVDTVEKLPSAHPEIIRCKDCKHRMVNAHFGEREYISLKAMCELDTGDPFELGRCAENDDWYCADAERRTDEL